MLLTIDVGNTQTVLGVFKQDQLEHMWRLATNKTQTADELRLSLLALLKGDNLAESEIGGSVLASVVPELTSDWKRALGTIFGKPPVVCSVATAGKLFQASYENPAEIGADRVADAVAAKAIYGAPVIVVDFGTATNLEVIDRHGNFVGGIIAPGLETSAHALFSRATKLPTIELADPHTAIGKNTVHAIRSGIVYGEADRVDGFVKRVFDELGYETPVVATGGLASTMAPLCRTITHINPELTLDGLRLIYEESQP